MAVTTKILFPATSNSTTTDFSLSGLQLNNQDDLDVYVTKTTAGIAANNNKRILHFRQSTSSNVDANHNQVNNTDGLYFPAITHTGGTETLENYQIVNNNGTVRFNSALPSGAIVFVERRTRDADGTYTSFASGSTIRAKDLNDSSTESNFTAQEARNKALTIEGVLFDGDQPSTNFVTSNHIVDGSIVNADINASADIDASKLANLSVTREKIHPDAIDGTKLADDAVNSEHYTDGSIDHVHLANDIIDGDNIQDSVINSEHYVAGSIDHVHLANDIIDGDNIQDDVVDSEHIAAGALDNEHYAAGSITSDKLSGATVVTNSEQAASTPNDTSFFTTAAAEARYFNASTGETIKDGQTFPDNDTTIATTAAINDRIIDLVDDVGGFVPIANETSFPTSNPDINNGSGTLVSIQSISSTRTPSSGTVTIANGAGTGNTVSITGCGSTVLAAGFGIIVETTSTLHTYAFHRLVPKATEVTTVAGKATEIGRLGTAAAVEDMSILGTAETVADMAILGTTDVVNDLNILGTADVVADLNTLGTADVVNDMNILGTSANVTAMSNCSGSIASINNASSNLNSINNFGDKYQVAANNPSTDGGGNALAAGDLYFNTSANELKVYNGSAWQGGVTATGNFAVTTGNTFTGDNRYNDGVKALFGTGSDLEIFHDGSHSRIKDVGTGGLLINASEFAVKSPIGENILRGVENDATELYYDGVKKLNTRSNGIFVSGLVETGTFLATSTSEFRNNVKFDGATSGVDINFFRSTNSLGFSTNAKANFGSSGNFSIYYDGTDNILKGDSSTVFRNAANNETLAKFTPNGSVELYHDNTKRYETHAYGSKITASGAEPHGSNATSRAALNLSGQFGGGLALDDLGNGGFTHFLSGAGAVYNISTAVAGLSTEKCIEMNRNGNVELYYDNSKRFETTSIGTIFSSSNHYINSNNGSLFFGGNSGNYGANAGIGVAQQGHYHISGSSAGDLCIAAKTGKNLLFGTRVSGNGSSYKAAKIHSDFTFEVNGNLQLPNDTKRIKLGASQDLEIYHDGTDSYIENNTGNLYINYGSDKGVKIEPNAKVQLFYDNALKLETTSTGTLTTGFADHRQDSTSAYSSTGIPSNVIARFYNESSTNNSHASISFGSRNSGGFPDKWYITCASQTSSFDADLAFSTRTSSTDTSEVLRFTNDGHLQIPNDNGKLQIGAGQDLQIFHDGSSSRIYNSTGDLVIRSASHNLNSADGTEPIIVGTENGSVDLYHDGSKKFETDSNGVLVSGRLKIPDNDGNGQQLVLGNSADLKLYHDGSNSYIQHGTVGNLRYQSGNHDFYNQAGDEFMCRMFNNGSVNLYYDHSLKFKTSSIGTQTDGNAVINGVTGGNSMQINLPDGNTDGVLINGGANQGRTIFRIKAGNATSGSSTSIRFTDSSGTDRTLLEHENNSTQFKTMNMVQGGYMSWWTNSTENSSGVLQRLVLSSRGSLQGSGDGTARPAFSFTNDTDTGMYRRSSNVIGFATAAVARYFMSGGAFAPHQDNADDLGGSSNRWDDVRATNSNIQTSDRTEKNTINPTDLGLDFINKLLPVSYKWNKGKNGVGKRTHYGLIAQDVETTLKDIGKTAIDFAGFCYDKPLEDVDGNTIENPREYYGLRYGEFMAPMIKAIQELSTEVNNLKTKVAALEAV